MNIGASISKLRKMRGYHQDSLAARSGLAQGYLSQIENNRREPSKSVLETLAKYLDVPVPLILLLSIEEKDTMPGKESLLEDLRSVTSDLISDLYPKKINLPKHLVYLLGFPNDEIVAIADAADRYYRTFRKYKKAKDGSIKLKNGKKQYREINEVLEPLRTIQDKIMNNILANLDVPDVLFGGVRKKNNILNAKKHLGKKYGFVTDLRDFYPSVNPRRVYEVFSGLDFPPDIARLLTRLTTRKNELPQGAPTSSYLANFAFIPVDSGIIEFCNEHEITYTRYIDDLTFTSQKDFKDKTYKIIELITESGFRINHTKTYYKIGPLEITGIIRRNNSLAVPEYIMERMKEFGLTPEVRAGLARYATNVNENNKVAKEKLKSATDEMKSKSQGKK